MRSLLALLLMFTLSMTLGCQHGSTPIFNGRDLEGWSGDPGGYAVVDGVLICGKEGVTNGHPGLLHTKDTFDDFVLDFEFRLTAGANNGIGIRVPVSGDPAYAGMEIQVLDNSAEVYATLKPYQYHGSIYGVCAAARGALKPVGEWNRERIVADGDQIRVILNGTVIVDYALTDARLNGTIDGNDHPGIARSGGHIVICGHGDHVEYRNMRVRELK